MSKPLTADPALQVKIRMYRPGLGDCFLLTFVKGPVTRHILIDCGVLQNTADQAPRLQKIVEDILAQTGGKLYALVATHEHADHLAGFDFQAGLFKAKFAIDQAWMAWTENKADPDVKETYRQYWKITTETLDIAIKELEKQGKNAAHYKEIQDFLSDGLMDVVKGLGKPYYWAPCPNKDGPAQMIEIDGLPEVKVHVLAPPKDLNALKRGDPPKTKHQLDQGQALNPSTTLTAAIYHLGQQGKTWTATEDFSDSDVNELFQASLPFDRTRGLPLEKAAQDDAFFNEHYGADNAWQRIDTEWLEAVGALALDLDSDVNNTSLVLAFELTPSQKVLLFAADAQYGNWKSWTDTVKGKDLLSRTVFYKVGHHGSHNATQLEGGLLAMGSADLVAMIPVDREKAQSKKWEMPAQILEKLLKAQTKGRVISAFEARPAGVTDPILPFQPPAFPKDNVISQADWDQFIGEVKADTSAEALWVEYTLTG